MEVIGNNFRRITQRKLTRNISDSHIETIGMVLEFSILDLNAKLHRAHPTPVQFSNCIQSKTTYLVGCRCPESDTNIIGKNNSIGA